MRVWEKRQKIWFYKIDTFTHFYKLQARLDYLADGKVKQTVVDYIQYYIQQKAILVHAENIISL